MDTEILRYVFTQTVFGGLFVWLLHYVLQENGKREFKYQEVIDKLSEKLGVINDIKDDVEEIKGILKNERR